MKLLVVDTETTGLSVKFDAIVELGIVLVDTKTGEVKKVFDKVVKGPKWNAFKHKNAWIFQNSSHRKLNLPIAERQLLVLSMYVPLVSSHLLWTTGFGN